MPPHRGPYLPEGHVLLQKSPKYPERHLSEIREHNSFAKDIVRLDLFIYLTENFEITKLAGKDYDCCIINTIPALV